MLRKALAVRKSSRMKRKDKSFKYNKPIEYFRLVLLLLAFDLSDWGFILFGIDRWIIKLIIDYRLKICHKKIKKSHIG